MLKLNTQFNDNLVFQAYSPRYDDDDAVDGISYNITASGESNRTREVAEKQPHQQQQQLNHRQQQSSSSSSSSKGVRSGGEAGGGGDVDRGGGDHAVDIDVEKEMEGAKRKLEADKVKELHSINNHFCSFFF